MSSTTISEQTKLLENSPKPSNAIANISTNATDDAQEWRFGDLPIRTVMRNGDVWFVLIDICRVLGLTNATKSAGQLKAHERETLTLSAGLRTAMPDLPASAQWIIVISESGFYRLVMRSNKPEAERFQTWVTGTVLPTIRKTGSYSVDPAAAFLDALRDPAKVLALIGDYATRLIAADAKVEEATNRADSLAAAHDRFASHDGTFSGTVAAKTLGVPPKKLFTWLAAGGWIYRPGGRGEYVAYQTKLQQGLLIMATHEIKKSDGDIQEISRVRITTKGLDKIALALNLPTVGAKNDPASAKNV